MDSTQTTDSTAPVQTPAQTSADDIAPPGSVTNIGLKAGVLTDATKVTPGSVYNGVTVPHGASAVIHGNWVSDNGELMMDEPINPDNSVNRTSSAYNTQWYNNLIAKGVSPMIAAEMVKPAIETSKAAQDLAYESSDKQIALATAQMGLQKSQAEYRTNVNNSIAAAYATGTANGGGDAGGQRAASAAAQAAIQQADSLDASGRGVPKLFPELVATDPKTGKQVDPATGVSNVVKNAIASSKVAQVAQQTAVSGATTASNTAAASAQAVPQAVAATKTAEAGAAIAPYKNVQTAVEDLAGGQQNISATAGQVGASQRAVDLFNQLNAAGQIGGRYDQILLNLKKLEHNNQYGAAASELESYLSTSALQAAKTAATAGGGRSVLNKPEYEAVAGTQVNDKMAAGSIVDLLAAKLKVDKYNADSAVAKQTATLAAAKQLPGLDTSAYEKQLASAQSGGVAPPPSQIPGVSKDKPQALSLEQIEAFAKTNGGLTLGQAATILHNRGHDVSSVRGQ